MKKIKLKWKSLIRYNPHFDIEENHCAGTGIVSSTLEKLIKYHDKNNTCWDCSLEESKCTILK